MHVAHFVQRYPPALGGSEAYFQRLSRYLTAKAHTVTVWTTTAIDLESFWSKHGRVLPADTTDDMQVRVRRFGLWRWPLRRYMLKALSLYPNHTWQALTMPSSPTAPDMWRAAGRDTRPCDIVHATAFPYAFPIACARRLARRRGVPFVLTPFLHLGDPENPSDRTRRSYLAPPLRALLLDADRVFVQTPSEKRAVIDAGIAAQRIVLQGLGVDPAECAGGDRRRARKAWGIDESETVIGHLANLSYEKGTIDLLQAAQSLWQRGLPFRVVLAGPDMNTFRRFWDAFPEKDSVVRFGVLDDSQKRDFFAGIDVFALPSRSDSFGLVLLEAWANGVPNIAYRSGGIADVIRDEQDGLLVPCGSIAALTVGIERLVTQPQLRQRLGNAGRERTGREFRWDEKLAAVERVYQELTAPKERLLGGASAE